MEAPPPFAPPRPKSKTGLIIGIIVGVVAICCLLPVGGIVGLGFFGLKKGKGLVECAFAMGAARDSLIRYAADHDGKLPGGEHWQSDLKPYYDQLIPKQQEAGPFKIPTADQVISCEGEGTPSGVAYNTALAAKKLDSFKDKFSTVAFFEVPTAKMNQAIPFKTQSDATSPTMLGKHRGWFQATLEGPLVLVHRGQRAPFNVNAGGSNGFNFNVDDKEDSPTTPPAPPAK